MEQRDFTKFEIKLICGWISFDTIAIEYWFPCDGDSIHRFPHNWSCGIPSGPKIRRQLSSRFTGAIAYLGCSYRGISGRHHTRDRTISYLMFSAANSFDLVPHPVRHHQHPNCSRYSVSHPTNEISPPLPGPCNLASVSANWKLNQHRYFSGLFTQNFTNGRLTQRRIYTNVNACHLWLQT